MIGDNSRIVLVSGGGGFIGSNLVRRLLKLGYKVNLIWKKSTDPWRILSVKNQLIFHDVNLLDKSSLNNLFKIVNPIAIFHLSTYSNYRDSSRVKEMVETNVYETLNLLLSSLETDYKIFVNSGSSSEYGINNKPMKESDLIFPSSFYAATKAISSLLCQSFAVQYKKPIVTLRLFSVYGPFEQKDRFIPTIINSILNQNTIRITPGLIKRDFIFVEDVLDAYIKCVKNSNKLRGEILNIGTGKEYSNDDLVQNLFNIANKKVKVEKGEFPERSWDNNHWFADISKAKKILNWNPKFSINQGLSETYRWFIQNQKMYS